MTWLFFSFQLKIIFNHLYGFCFILDAQKMPVSTSNDQSKSTNFNKVLKELKKEKNNYFLDTKSTEESLEIEISSPVNVNLQEALAVSEGTNLNETKQCVAELAVFKPNKKNYKRNTVEVNENKSKKTTKTVKGLKSIYTKRGSKKTLCEKKNLKRNQKENCENICVTPPKKTSQSRQHTFTTSPELFNVDDLLENVGTNTYVNSQSCQQNEQNLNLKKRKLSNSNITKPLGLNLTSPPASPIEKKRSKLENSMSVYDYRHHASNSHVSGNNKNESNNSSYVSKGENEDDENLINSYYSGHRYLGGSNNSIATLCNIGNSCYLNSVVYTLRFAPFFLHKLHHLVDDMRQVYQKVGQHKLKSSSLGRNVSGLQNQSARSWSSKDLASLGSNNSHANGSETVPKNNRQIATEKLHELYQNLHRNESVDTSDPYHAGTFLQSIQDVSSIFEGNQQQDAHELLMCILDSIRETCSALIKTINDHPEVVNEHPPLPEQNELSPSQQQQHHQSLPTSQSIKSIFTRKKRKDTFKVSKSNSPMKENHSEVATVLSAIENDGTGTVIKNNLNNVTNNNENSDSNSDLNNATSPTTTTTTATTTTALSEKEKINEKIKKLGLDFFREDFEGITLSTTKCLTCETVTEQKETMVDIAIPISAANDTISDPQMFIQVCLKIMKTDGFLIIYFVCF